MDGELRNIDPRERAKHGPLDEPVFVRGSDLEAGSLFAAHRGGGRKSRHFGFFDRERGVAWLCGMTQYTRERLNPRHRHTFDQVRYYLKGGEKYGREAFGPGDVVYFPESIPYGPTSTADGFDGNVRVTMQFMGPSRIPYHHIDDINQAQEDIKNHGRFEGGAFRWDDGHNQDSYEAVITHLTGEKPVYPEPRYNHFIAMHSDAFPWCPYGNGVEGVWVRHLAYFNEIGPNIKMLKIDPGAATPAAEAVCEQVRLLVDGEATYEGEDYSSVSGLYLPPNVPFGSIASKTGATFLVVQRAAQDGTSPEYALA
jgi:hypothetical protein